MGRVEFRSEFERAAGLIDLRFFPVCLECEFQVSWEHVVLQVSNHVSTRAPQCATSDLPDGTVDVTATSLTLTALEEKPYCAQELLHI